MHSRAALVAIGVASLAVAMAPAATAGTGGPTPTPTAVGGLAPGQPAAVPAPSEHIVKDTSTDPSCTGYRSQTTPPKTIRVFLHASQTIATVDFQSYVDHVLPSEWIPSWAQDPNGIESLKAGAVAVKSYAWYWVNHYGGYFGTSATSSNCFDVDDTTNFQVFQPGNSDPATDAAVQQTWGVIARDATTHQIRQTGYRADLVSHTSGHDVCGQGADGSTMSQWGSHACAVTNKPPLDYASILRTYYFANGSTPALELAMASLGPVSAPASGQVLLSAVGTLAAYRMSGGAIFGAQQPKAGAPFGVWSRFASTLRFSGQPRAIKASNGAVAIYARAGSGIYGDGQPAVGRPFSGWHLMGGTGHPIASDPVPVLMLNGTLALFATDTSGVVVSVTQAAVGASFTAWTPVGNVAGFAGPPVAVVTAAGTVAVYARNGSVIEGAGQASAGGAFGAFSTIGSGAVPATGYPTAFQAGDGTISVVTAGAPGVSSNSVWMASQPAPGTRFGAWRQVSNAADYSSAATVFPSGSVSPIGFYAAEATGVVRGAQAATPASQLSGFGQIGANNPGAVSDLSLVVTSTGAVGLYVMGAGGILWGAGQSAPGARFSDWTTIGSSA